MKNVKRLTTLILALALTWALALPGFAAGTGFTDVPSNAWYAGAVEYAVEHQLMDGVGNNRFDPDGDTSRAMLVTILWRMAGRPQVNYLMQFPDVGSDWYTEAVRWAASERIVGGYDDGRFGPNDPVSREQIVTILWRYQGSPAAERGQDFADEGNISGYATQAVDWARQNNVVNGRGGNRFEPHGHATRAEAATILQNFRSIAQEPAPSPEPTPAPAPQSKTLVVYYSATGSTQRVAGYIADTLDADTFELTPTQPYTSEDLNWTTPGSRVNREHDDESLRDVKLTANTVANWADYDTVFIGYPIWWGIAAWPVNDFIKNNDFTGKTVIPFCTSSSSGLGQSGELLAQMAGTGNWQTGQRFSSGASEQQVSDWVSSLNLTPSVPGTNIPGTSTPGAEKSRVLVTYFSMPETTSSSNMTTEEDNSVVVIDGQVLGNTQYMAQVIQETTGGDIFRIEPVTPYPTDHSTLVSLASQEQGSNARPAIRGQVSNMDEYDVIFVGYPIWWSNMPMILYTFFEQYDLSGKTIVPFSTHGGSSFAGTPAKIQGLEPNARMLDGLTISRNNIQDARQQIVDWVNGLGLN